MGHEFRGDPLFQCGGRSKLSPEPHEPLWHHGAICPLCQARAERDEARRRLATAERELARLKPRDRMVSATPLGA